MILKKYAGKRLITLLLASGVGFSLVAGEIREDNTRRLGVRSIVASSALKDKKIVGRYSSAYIMDGNENTSWCEGVPGNGIGQTITITFKRPVRLFRFFLKNGYHDQRYWASNNRVKSIRLIGYSSKDVKDDRHIFMAADHEYWQTEYFTMPFKMKKVELRIEEIFKGSRWADTCIAEIGFSAAWKHSDDPVLKPNARKAPFPQGIWAWSHSDILWIKKGGVCLARRKYNAKSRDHVEFACNWLHTKDGRIIVTRRSEREKSAITQRKFIYKYTSSENSLSGKKYCFKADENEKRRYKGFYGSPNFCLRN